MTRRHGRAVAGGLAMALVLGAGCSRSGGSAGGSTGPPSARPSSTAKLAIVEPKNGQVVHGSDVHLDISLAGARVVPATTRNLRPDEGHVHVLLDNQLVSMTYGLSQDIPNVSPGMHVIRVEFVASDHAPFDPRVFTAVTFEVKK